jgi:hypothetical protein
MFFAVVVLSCKIINLGLPQSDTDGTTKGYVDLRRNYITLTVWASVVGTLNNNHYEFRFGSTVRNVKNNGYTILSDGIIEKIWLTGGSLNTDTIVNLVINGVDKGMAYSITNPKKTLISCLAITVPCNGKRSGCDKFHLKSRPRRYQ